MYVLFYPFNQQFLTLILPCLNILLALESHHLGNLFHWYLLKKQLQYLLTIGADISEMLLIEQIPLIFLHQGRQILIIDFILKGKGLPDLFLLFPFSLQVLQPQKPANREKIDLERTILKQEIIFLQFSVYQQYGFLEHIPGILFSSVVVFYKCVDLEIVMLVQVGEY